MFNIQKCPQTMEVYINYNEYMTLEEDECVDILEHIFPDEEVKEFKGIIDLITVKVLPDADLLKIREIHDTLRKKDIRELNVISDNERLLEEIKNIMPDISTTLLKIK